MIIQKLCSYYERLLSDPDSNIAPPNYSAEKIHFAIVINKDGDIIQTIDLRKTVGRFKIPKSVIVPASVKRSSGISPNFLWDNTKYVFGVTKKEKDFKHAKECYESFKTYHIKMGKNINDEGYTAFLNFLNKWKPEYFDKLEYATDIMDSNVIFKLEDDSNIYLHKRSAIKELWTRIRSENQSTIISQCLVDGEMQPIAKVHPAIKGVVGAKSSGAALISFNVDSSTSYGKEQNFNAPMSEESVFSYTTALNYLLSKKSRQKINIGDTTIVFWTEQQSPLENIIGLFFNSKRNSDETNSDETNIDENNSDETNADEANSDETNSDSDDIMVFDFLNAIHKGQPMEGINPNINFYILGLGSHISRIFVRFWYALTIDELEKRLNEYISDMEIEKQYQDEEQYPKIQKYMYELISKNIKNKEIDSFLSILGSRLLQSILTGTMYPYELLTTTIDVIKADSTVNYYRASLIKGYLTKYYRIRNINWEVGMSLNTEFKSVGYLLGRLFATAEKIQQEANSKATIHDNFFVSAMESPSMVFSDVIKSMSYYLPKLSNEGRIINMKKLIHDIVGDILEVRGAPGFPSYLTKIEQCEFASGYYQQTREFYNSSKENSKEDKAKYKKENSKEASDERIF